MSIIRRALLIVPAALAALALSGTAAQASTDVVFGDDNTVTNDTTTNNLTSVDDSFNEISTVDIQVAVEQAAAEHLQHDHVTDDGDDD
ncbi:hypothetical protein [Actinosynnema sp. NPDC023587]|uniref:hypothetical protein n=1 Tax=Actinosynnema sp. NPDC023587 TaxID=3154695 RepID=UPI0033C04DB5